MCCALFRTVAWDCSLHFLGTYLYAKLYISTFYFKRNFLLPVITVAYTWILSFMCLPPTVYFHEQLQIKCTLFWFPCTSRRGGCCVFQFAVPSWCTFEQTYCSLQAQQTHALAAKLPALPMWLSVGLCSHPPPAYLQEGEGCLVQRVPGGTCCFLHCFPS